MSAPTMTFRLRTFHAACWVMGLVAFVELVAVGVALALQKQRPPETRIVERVKYVPLADLGVPAPVAPGAA